ncbi:trypsin-like serine peptidase [Photobacterium leiognathi]|uniref:trypsin-like serine peptidase n=1 Tax=Photobacterium leiognathi TaxID=553611 RepID=UPI002981D9EC|nr:trypsin-like serine protease [Photobacterium leiognathi]
MKTITKITLAIIGLTSASAHAIVGGTSVDESLYQQYVTYTAGNQRCSGTIVGGKYILSAAHCMTNAQVGNIKDQRLIKFTTNPDDLLSRGFDIAIATIEEQYKTPTITFLSDSHALDNESVDVFGWSTGALKYAIMQTGFINNNIPQVLFLSDVGEGYTESGDSGSPVLINNQIISVHSGSSRTVDSPNEAEGSRIEYSRDFILSTINDWHSPTELKFTGNKTIEIQSLHVSDTNLAERWNAGTLTTGDVTVTGGTCVTDTIAPFGTCTLDVNAGAGEGTIKLTDNNIVTINRAAIVEPDTGGSTDKDNNNSGGGGGSLGWLTLLALLPLAWRRK